MSTLESRDRAVVWHPYAPPRASPLFGVESASGVRLRLTDGRELVDGMSSWWSTIHGYRHPHIEAAMHAQLERMPHVMFGGAHPRRRRAPLRASRRAHAVGSRARLPERLGLGGGRDRDQDGAPDLARARASGEAPPAHDPRRLSRRHVRGDGGVRSRDGHARTLRRRAPETPLRAATGDALWSAARGRRRRTLRGRSSRAHAHGARRGDPRADRPGRRGHVVLLGRLPEGRPTRL